MARAKRLRGRAVPGCGVRLCEAASLAEQRQLIAQTRQAGVPYPHSAHYGQRVRHQEGPGWCVSDSVANLTNATPADAHLLRTTLGFNGSVGVLGRLLNQDHLLPWRLDQHKAHAGDSDKAKLAEILSLREGLFLLTFRKHCVGWDAGTGSIHDPDSRYPWVLPATQEALDLYKLNTVRRIHKLSPS